VVLHSSFLWRQRQCRFHCRLSGSFKTFFCASLSALFCILMALVSPFTLESFSSSKDSPEKEKPWLPLFLRRITVLLRAQARLGPTPSPTALLPSTYVYVNDLDRTSFTPWIFSTTTYPLPSPPEPYAVNCYEAVLTPLLRSERLPLAPLQAAYRTSLLVGGRFWPRSTSGSSLRTLLNLLFQNLIWEFCISSSTEAHATILDRQLVWTQADPPRLNALKKDDVIFLSSAWAEFTHHVCSVCQPNEFDLENVVVWSHWDDDHGGTLRRQRLGKLLRWCRMDLRKRALDDTVRVRWMRFPALLNEPAPLSQLDRDGSNAQSSVTGTE
jgi:hypothetical protein